VIGGAAAIAHGSARLTQDLDIVYERSPENLKRLVAAWEMYKRNEFRLRTRIGHKERSSARAAIAMSPITVATRPEGSTRSTVQGDEGRGQQQRRGR
jgi:hypothetical protein